MPDHLKRLEAAQAAVFLACALCRRLQARLDSLGSMTKGDRSSVTVADLAAQAVIAHTLRERLGRVTLVAEEDAAELKDRVARGDRAMAQAVADAVQTEWPGATMDDVLEAIDLGGAMPSRDDLHGFWTLDPIDGTRGFLQGEQYAVCLAWIENGSPILGVLGCPNLSKDFSRPLDDPDPHGTLYVAGASEGLVELPADEPNAQPLVIHRLEPAEDEPLRLCESRDSAHTRHEDTERILELLGDPAEPMRLDGQAKYILVARGQADAYLRLVRRSGYVERIWDHAAGALAATETGCAVTDLRGNALDFSHGRGLDRNRGVVVATPVLHGRIMAAVEELGLRES